MIGNVNALSWASSMRSALGLTANIKDSLVFQLDGTVEDALYPNKVGYQDRVASGGEVFPGRGIEFDGVNQAIAYPNSVISAVGTSNITVSMHLKVTSLASTTYIMGYNESPGASYLRCDSGGQLRFYWAGASGGVQINIYTNTGVILENTWHHVLISVDRAGAGADIYVDGVDQTGVVSTVTNTESLSAGTEPFTLGRYSTSEGAISAHDFRVWSTDLTFSESELVRKGESVQSASLALWDFLESTDTLESFDASGNERHGVAENFDSTSFIEGNWQSLYNKYGYAIDVTDNIELITNGTFDADTNWTKGTGVTISGGAAHISAGSSESLRQDTVFPAALVGRKAKSTYNISNYSAGTWRIRLGDLYGETISGGDGAYSELITVGSGGQWRLYTVTSLTCDVDDVSCQAYYDTAIPPDMSTLSNGVPTHDIFGNVLTFAGQAKYEAIARDRSCLIGDGATYADPARNIVINDALDSGGMTFRVKCYIPDDGLEHVIAGSSSSSTAIMIRRTNTDTLNIQLWDGTNILSVSSASGASGEMDVMFRIRREDIEIWQDGVLLDSDTSPDVTNTVAGNLRMFRRASTTALETGGKIYWIRYHNAHLTWDQEAAATPTHNWQFVEGNGDTVHDVSGNGNHLEFVNMDETNWGVIDMPVEDYLAENGCNLSVRRYDSSEDGILATPITLSYDDAFTLRAIAKADTGEYLLGDTIQQDDYFRLTSPTTMTIELNNEPIVFSNAGIDLRNRSDIYITKPASSNVLTVTVDDKPMTPGGSYTFTSGFSVQFNQLWNRYSYTVGAYAELYKLEWNGVDYDLLFDTLLESNSGLEQGIIPASAPFDRVARFDGTSDWIESDGLKTFNLTSGDATFMFKYKMDGTGIGLPLLGYDTRAYSLVEITSSNQLVLESDVNADTVYGVITADTNWHTAIIIVENGVGRIYQDGAEIVMSNTDIYNDVTLKQIGRARSASYFNGLIENVSVVERAITTAEVAAYENGGVPDDAYWNFDLTGQADTETNLGSGSETFTWNGTGDHEGTIPGDTNTNKDVFGLDLMHPQSGKNLIPYTYLSMPEDIYELYAADQNERYEEGLMVDNFGTFDTRLGDSLMDAGKGDFNIDLGPELIDQSLWNTEDYWDTFDAGWSVLNGDLYHDGTSGFLTKYSFWTVGKRYRITVSGEYTSGGGMTGPYDGSGGEQSISSTYTTGRTFSYDVDTGSGLQAVYIFGGACVGKITGISIKEILNDSEFEGVYQYLNTDITNVDDALRIQYVDHAFGFRFQLRETGDINTDLTVGQRYRITVTAKGENMGNQKIQLYDGSVYTDIAPSLTADWVTYTLDFTANDATACIWAGGNFSGTEVIWIDSWTFQEITDNSDLENWTAYGNNTISNDDGALKIAYADNGAGAYVSMSTLNGNLNTDLVVGDTYRIHYRAKKNEGNPKIYLSGPNIYGDELTTEYAWYEIEFVATATTGNYVRCVDMSGNEIIWLDQWFLLRKATPTGNNLATNAGARNAIGALIDTDWDKTTGLYDIIAFEDYASTVDGATKVRTLGDELVTNGDFANWTGDNPDNWSNYVEDANNYVTENPAGEAQIVSDGSLTTGIYQAILTADDWYLVEVEITAVTSGSITVLAHSNIAVLSTVGKHRVILQATGGYFIVRASSGTADVTVDNISCKKITTATSADTDGVVDTGRLVDQIPQGSDLVTNGDFATDLTGWTNTDSAWTWSAGTAACNGVGTDARMYQNILTVGKYYVATIECTSYTSGALRVRLGGTTTGAYTTINSIGTFTVVGRAENVYLMLTDNGETDFVGSIDNVSAKELEVLGDDVITNGDFATDTDWGKGTGWTISGGTASCDGTQTGSSSLNQDIGAVEGEWYVLKYTVSNYSAGLIRARVGGSTYYSSYRSANGTYTDLLYCDGNSSTFWFWANVDFIGDVDNVSVHKLTWGRQISDDSTNYAGFQFALPVDEFDFIVPVGYTAESIVDQQFHDGRPDGVEFWSDNTFVPNMEIVSGRSLKIIGGQYDANYYYGFQRMYNVLTVGQAYGLKIRYRTNLAGTFQYRFGSAAVLENVTVTDDGEWYEINTYSDPVTADATTFYFGHVAIHDAQPGDYFEIDYIEVRPVLDSEFYEPESIGGDPVIVSVNYLAANPSRYLARYFNAVQWKDLILVSPDNLSYTDHIKLMKFTKNS